MARIPLRQIKLNIFFVHSNPITAANSLNDKHVVKMILETGQLLCSVLAGVEEIKNKFQLYKPTHRHHPATTWAKGSIHNFRWLEHHFWALNRQYTMRFKKVHSSTHVLGPVLESVSGKEGDELLLTGNPRMASNRSFPPMLTGKADIDKLHDPDVTHILTRRIMTGPTIDPDVRRLEIKTIASYRLYYCTNKFPLGEWSFGTMPHWYKEFHEHFGAKVEIKERVRKLDDGKFTAPVMHMVYPSGSNNWQSLFRRQFEVTPDEELLEIPGNTLETVLEQEPRL